MYCPECGTSIPAGQDQCPGCGLPVARAPRGGRSIHPSVKFLAWCFVALIITWFIFAMSKLAPTPSARTGSAGGALPASVTNDADLLVYRCGTPNKDDSTATDNPRPPIPTRLITYTQAHLMFAYYPGDEAKVGDPPPYNWKLLGIKDTRTNVAIRPEQLKDALSRRLPCALGN